MSNNTKKTRQYIEVPLPLTCGILRQLWNLLIGIVLVPWYLLISWILKTPGIVLHLKFAIIGLRLLFTRRLSLRKCLKLILSPMDSTRYFEFHEIFKNLSNSTFTRYLDVSSPRLVPLILIKQDEFITADLINPDSKDIEETIQIAEALGIKHRCKFSDNTIEAAGFLENSFDLITCISVLEHIPSDTEAVKKMWSLLSPGGRLILTLPCMAQPLEQYISVNNYGVLGQGEDGYTFWQRFYDEENLCRNLYSVTGEPATMRVYGEKNYGLFFRNATAKRLMGPLYPYWRESFMMAREYRYYETVNQLPGEGVVMLEFVKP